MYLLPHFTEHDKEVIVDFIQSHPFAVVTGTDGHCCAATQIPLLCETTEEQWCFWGHIMKGTDHHKVFLKNPEILVLFTGPSCYISASLYTGAPSASTWNYITVQVKGNLEFTDDSGTLEIIKKQTRWHESHYPRPIYVEDMPDEYIQKNLSAIQGFKINVQSIYPIFKLSQNKDDQTYSNIVHHLLHSEDPGAQQIAREMRIRRPQLPYAVSGE